MKDRVSKYVVGDKVYFQSVEGSILNSESKEIVSGDFHLIGSNGTCYCIDNKTKEIYILINDKLDKTKFIGHSIYEVDSNMILVFNETESQNITTAFRNGKMIWKTNDKRFSTVISNRYLAYKPKYKTNEVIVKNIETNDIAFRFLFNEDFKVARKSHINGDDLIVSLMKKDLSESRIACLSISECHQKWNIQSNSHEHLMNKEKLYALTGSISKSRTELEVIDAISGKLLSLTIQETERDIMPWNCSIYRYKLYFSNNHNGCTIGTIDLRTNHILKEHKLNLKKGVKIYEPINIDGELIVRDTMNNVHRIQKGNHT